MQDELSEQWPGLEKCPWKDRYSPTWHQVRATLPKARDGLKPQCTARCPRCRAMCMYKEGHKDKHDCYHQPGGITGGCWGGTRILAEKDCVQHVEDGD